MKQKLVSVLLDRVRKMKILLVEDSKFQRVANGQALVRAGYSVIHAAPTGKRVSVPHARASPILFCSI